MEQREIKKRLIKVYGKGLFKENGKLSNAELLFEMDKCPLCDHGALCHWDQQGRQCSCYHLVESPEGMVPCGCKAVYGEFFEE